MSTTASPPALLATRAASYSVQRTRILREIDLAVRAGEMLAIAGPNGSGKTTLLRLLAGIRPATSGAVELDGRSISRLSRAAIARRLSYLPQNTWTSFDITVHDAVAMGRFPHLGAFRAMGEKDVAAVRAAIERMDLTHLVARILPSLSGGERQRVFLARALAQEAEILILDEPTSSLDIGHQLQLMQILRELNAEGKTIVAAMHDLQLAWEFFPTTLLLHEGEALRGGATREVLTSAEAQEAFQVCAALDSSTNSIRFELPRR